MPPRNRSYAKTLFRLSKYTVLESGAEFAFLFGTTRPFDAATLARLYPGGRSDWLARFEKATADALARAFLLEADAAEIRALAAATPW